MTHFMAYSGKMGALRFELAWFPAISVCGSMKIVIPESTFFSISARLIASGLSRCSRYVFVVISARSTHTRGFALNNSSRNSRIRGVSSPKVPISVPSLCDRYSTPALNCQRRTGKLRKK